MLRIVITGAESTGKTTLTEALSGYYGAPWTGEFVREFASGLDRPIRQSDLETIAKGQLAQESLITAPEAPVLFHDTNILSSIICANHYFDTILDWVNESFLSRPYDLYLLCLPDIPWTAEDGQRDSPEARDTLHAKFKESLDTLKLPYVEISGDEVERMGQAVQAIDARLNPDYAIG